MMYGQMTDPVAITALGQLLAERLYEAGVRRAYGFPGGGSNLDLMERFEDAGITWVLAHTEGGAAFMACADAEINRVPGVLVVGNGPGLASAVNGVAHAWLDRVPLVVISDRYTEAEAATSGHQVLDQRALLAPVVKYGATLEPVSAAQVVDEALVACQTAPWGPVHFDMRRDAAGEYIPSRGQALKPVSRGGVDREAVVALADRLLAAERPVVLIGLEANEGVSPQDLKRIVHETGAVALTTYKAKGIYPENDPRWAGILTGAEIERPFLEHADLLVAVGLDVVELLGRPWPYESPVLSIAASEESDGLLAPERRVVGDIAEAVSMLAGLVGHAPPSEGFSEREVEGLREAALSSLRLDDEEPLPAWRIVETVMAQLPAQTTLTVDAGAHMFPVTNFARLEGRGRFLISNGLATMGFAVPSALGAALARPGEVSVAFTGDGGMAYHADELETAVRVGAKVIVVVFNDSSLSLIRIKQEAKGFMRSPLNFGLTRFDLLAEALGVYGVMVEDEAGLRTAVKEAVGRDGSTVIDVRMTGQEYRRTLEAVRG